MNCGTCGAEVPAANVSIQFATARCDACGAVFSIGGDAETALDGATREVRRSTPVALPKGIAVTNTGAELRIARRFFSPRAIFLTVFTATWDVFVLVWFGIALSAGAVEKALFGTFHGLIGVGLTYLTLALWLNSTHIAVNKEHLVIYHRPLPWPGTRTLESSDIAQIYGKLRRSPRSPRRGVTMTKTTGIFELRAVMKSGEDLRLVAGLSTEDQVVFIEQEIERYLGIADRPIGGISPVRDR